MLRRLSVSNYAIIDHVELLFDSGLTTITGETGAGKSIILGALGMILGERADTDVLHDATKKCVIEGVFNVENIIPASFFTEHEIDYDAETIIRREIAPGGKSRAFINDTPSTLAVLKQLTSRLVDLHRPYQTRDLAERQFQTDMLDALCNHATTLQQYRQNWKRYNTVTTEITRLQEQQQKAQDEQDYLQFQYDELVNASLTDGEQEFLETELKQQEHAEEIKQNLAAVFALLSDGEYAVLTNVKEALRLLQHISKMASAAGELQSRLHAVQVELQDIADETERQQDSTELNPERLLIIQERLDTIYKLQKKHRAISTAALLDIQLNIQNQLKGLTSQTEQLEALQHEQHALNTAMHTQCQQITKTRTTTAKELEEKVHAMLPDVGMPHARLAVKLTTHNTFTYNGHDTIELLFAANKGSTLKPLDDVASVGEMSRLMLCLKSVVGLHMHLPTMIFDEIDTGISGQTAIRVGALLRQLAETQQVMTITHLPQIAGQGQRHYFVYKEDDAQRTYTRVRLLTADERVLAIAQMLSGTKPTDAAMKNARELLGHN